MEVVIVPDGQAAGRLVAAAVADLVGGRPTAVLGLATGSTPLPVYAELGRLAAAGTVRFDRCRAFLLDEYVGLPAGHPQSYRAVVDREVVGPLGFTPELVHGPDGAATDPVAACAAYEEAIRRAGGIDLQLLGIGADGHIGFNEPCSSLGSRTRIKTLTERTRADNARFFDRAGEVPTHVLTQGVATILEARHLVLLAVGATKAPAVAAAVEGPLAAVVPASVLQLHPHATVVVDEPAAAGLDHADYFRAAFAGKPAWQRL
jgi:glucosamine-6-phosphate deaminase